MQICNDNTIFSLNDSRLKNEVIKHDPIHFSQLSPTRRHRFSQHGHQVKIYR